MGSGRGQVLDQGQEKDNGVGVDEKPHHGLELGWQTMTLVE